MVEFLPVAKAASDSLIWIPERGFGYYPVKAGTAPYDAAYLQRYSEMARTFIGRQLSHARVDFVARHYDGWMVDVGVGCGAFIATRNRSLASHRFAGASTLGFDVNPEAVEMLRKRRLLLNPNKVEVPAISMWDVFEHIPDYGPLLANVTGWVFMSLPIFKDAAHVLRSKHFRKDEHCWYFTEEGLISEMHRHGFACAEVNRDEETLGREDIGSFAFYRVKP